MKSINNYEKNKQNETITNITDNNNIKSKTNINEELYNDVINIFPKDNNINKNKEDLILNLEKEIESILINLYNNRYINYKKKELSFSNKAYQFFNELKSYCFKSNKAFSFNILRILSKKMHSLINYIEENIDYENIKINEVIKIRDCVKNSGNDIEKIFEPALKKIDKSFDIENILLGIFVKEIINNDDRIFRIMEKEDENFLNNYKDESEYIEFDNYLINENDNEENNSFEQLEINYNFDFNEEEEKENENEINDINDNYNSNTNNINSNNNNLNNSNIIKKNNKGFDIDKFVDYINEGDNTKKNKKKKKKNKKNKNDNLMEFNHNNVNNESDDNDPIVDNFKKSLNTFSDNVNNIKIRPTFSKKWLKKIERMIN